MEEKLQASKYLQFLQRSDGFGLYHSLYGGLCIVDKNIKDVFKVFQTPKSARKVLYETRNYEEKQLKSFMSIFKSKSFLVKPGIDENAPFIRTTSDLNKNLYTGCQIGVVQLIMTNLCNLRCKYCFITDIYSSEERFRLQNSSHNRVLSIENARTYLEKIIEIVKKNGRKSLAIQFFGGEPLINWKVLRFILEHFGGGERYGIEIGYSIVTNGTLITEEIAKYFKNYNVSVIVSFDSPKATDRTYANGKNSINKAMLGLSRLNKYYNRIIFNSVLSEDTFQYFDTDLVDFALDHYIFEIGVLLDLDTEFYEKRETREIVEKLWSIYKYAKKRGVLLTGYWHMIFQQIVKHNLFKVRGFKTCSATGCQLSVEPSGDVFACKGSSGYFGNILDPEELLTSKNYRKYAMRTFRNARECDGCEIENFCSGFCLGPLEKKYGDIYVIEKNTCDIYKELTKRFIKDVGIDEVDAFRMPKVI